jgi:hypothetical protein
METTVYRLIYKSRSKVPIDWALVDSIIETSNKNNSRREITGVLLATTTHFLQVIEGSFERVNKLFSDIARDPRHEALQLVDFSCVERRAFGDWAMHGIGIFGFNKALLDQLKAAFGEEEGEVRLPTDVWQIAALVHDIRQIHD